MTTDLAFTPIDCGQGSAAGGRTRPPPSIRSSRPKAAGEQSLAGELSTSQQRWRSPTGGAAPTGRSSRTSQPRPGRRQRAPSTRVGLCITGSGPTRH